MHRAFAAWVLRVLAHRPARRNSAIVASPKCSQRSILQATPQDDDRVVGRGVVRDRAGLQACTWLTLSGSLDARVDSIEQVERVWRVDVRDRGLQRPAFSLRHAHATLRKGTLAVDVGKQFVRWGKADILNPTDRFAPRDFLEVTDDEFLAVVRRSRAVPSADRNPSMSSWVPDVHAEPHAAPRAALGGASPQTLGTAGFVDLGPTFPQRSQYGARWNVVGAGIRAVAVVFRRVQSPAAVHGGSAVRPAAHRAPAHVRAAAHGGTDAARAAPLVHREG